MKKNKKKEVSEEQVYYIGVQEPVELRRSILESSKELLQFMQRYEKYKEVRNEKREAVALLKAQMKDLGAMLSDLKSVLPATSLRADERYAKKELPASKITPKLELAKPELVKEEVKLVKVEAPKPEPPKQLSEIEKLEAELADIEGKLKDLT